MPIDIDSPYPLTDAQIQRFRRDGFIRLKDVFDAPTLQHYGREITRLTIARNTQTKPLEERSTYDRAFLQVMNLWQQGGVAREFVFGRRLARIAAALLEVEGVRLYHDQSLYKEPGGGFTPAMEQKKTRATIQNEAATGLKNVKGSVAMARTSAPHSASAQFFINHKDNGFLDYPGQDGWGYAVFGRVVKGSEVVDQIAAVKTGTKAGMGDVPLQTVAIISARRKK